MQVTRLSGSDKWKIILYLPDNTKDIRNCRGTLFDARERRREYMSTGRYYKCWIAQDDPARR